MKIDFIFSVGPACRPASFLKEDMMRVVASPLDWQMKYSLDTVIHLFETGFSDFFSDIAEDINQSGSGGNRCVTDRKNQIVSIHHFPKTSSCHAFQPTFIEKARKQYFKLNWRIEEAKVVALLCNRNDSAEKLGQFLKKFASLYPEKTFLMINVRHTPDLKENIILKGEYSFSEQCILHEYYFNDVNQIPNYEWRGNLDCWHTVLSKYQFTDDNEHLLLNWSGDVKLEASPNNAYNFYSIPIEAGNIYCAEVEEMLVVDGNIEEVDIALYDAASQRILDTKRFAVHSEKIKYQFGVPDMASDSLQLLLYAGTRGDTLGKSIVYKGVHLKQKLQSLSMEDNFVPVAKCNVEVSADDCAYNCRSIPLSSNTVYQFSLGGISCVEGELTTAEVLVYNHARNTVLRRFVLDKASSDVSFSFNVPDVGSDKINLIFYAGMRGATEKIGVVYTDVCLKKRRI